jgi:hypothetical protein
MELEQRQMDDSLGRLPNSDDGTVVHTQLDAKSIVPLKIGGTDAANRSADPKHTTPSKTEREKKKKSAKTVRDKRTAVGCPRQR